MVCPVTTSPCTIGVPGETVATPGGGGAIERAVSSQGIPSLIPNQTPLVGPLTTETDRRDTSFLLTLDGNPRFYFVTTAALYYSDWFYIT